MHYMTAISWRCELLATSLPWCCWSNSVLKPTPHLRKGVMCALTYCQARCWQSAAALHSNMIIKRGHKLCVECLHYMGGWRAWQPTTLWLRSLFLTYRKCPVRPYCTTTTSKTNGTRVLFACSLKIQIENNNNKLAAFTDRWHTISVLCSSCVFLYHTNIKNQACPGTHVHLEPQTMSFEAEMIYDYDERQRMTSIPIFIAVERDISQYSSFLFGGMNIRIVRGTSCGSLSRAPTPRESVQVSLLAHRLISFLQRPVCVYVRSIRFVKLIIDSFTHSLTHSTSLQPTLSILNKSLVGRTKADRDDPQNVVFSIKNGSAVQSANGVPCACV